MPLKATKVKSGTAERLKNWRQAYVVGVIYPIPTDWNRANVSVKGQVISE